MVPEISMNQFTKALHASYREITQPCSAEKYAVGDKAMRTRCRLAKRKPTPRAERVRSGACKSTAKSAGLRFGAFHEGPAEPAMEVV